MTCLGKTADEALAAGFDHYGIAGGQKLFSQRVNLFLEQRFAAGQFDERNACGRTIGQAIQCFDALEHIGNAHLLPTVKSIGGIAPGTAQIASGETDEDAGKAGAGSFALNGFKNLGDKHGPYVLGPCVSAAAAFSFFAVRFDSQ